MGYFLFGLGLVSPYLLAGIIIWLRTGDHSVAWARMKGMAKATAGVLETDIQ